MKQNKRLNEDKIEYATEPDGTLETVSFISVIIVLGIIAMHFSLNIQGGF